MQRMLQTCMEMQVELQRSVRQEVSAALNRCAGSTGLVSCLYGFCDFFFSSRVVDNPSYTTHPRPPEIVIPCGDFFFRLSDVDVCGDILLNDESKWDNVRKGLCCLCCNNNIDSLLYR